jgi:hypothetical protein
VDIKIKMTIQEFRANVKPGLILSVEGKDFFIREVIKFRFDDGSFYIKCILKDGYVFADDAASNTFLLVKEVRTLFIRPFDKELKFDAKRFKFLFTAHALAEDVYGEEIWKKGYGESFWDFKSEDGSYLSLGVSDETKERLDFCGRIISVSSVEINDIKI